MRVSGLLLFVGAISAELVTEATGSVDISACGEPEPEKPLVVGLYFLMDSYFYACSPYARAGILDDYLSAFVGGVQMRFGDVYSPAISIIYMGSRRLTEGEERDIIGKESSSGNAVKGVDALLKIMDISATQDDYLGSNKMFFVITGRNVTEEKTENVITDEDPTPGGSQSDKKRSGSNDDYDTYDDDGASSDIQSRSTSSKNKHPNVGGLAQYGTLCSVLGAVAIVQDDGRYFSGVEAAARQVATALGPKYNGSIPRRVCGEYDAEGGQDFHTKECQAEKTMLELQNSECLQEAVNKGNSTVKTPSDFFLKHREWTPCSVSYEGSKKCQEKAQEECKIKCCPNEEHLKVALSPISAPDGTECNSNQNCMNGACGFKAAAATGK